MQMCLAACKTSFGLVLAASLFFAVGSAHAAPSCVTGATTTCTFSYTGAPEAWVVPAGVTSAVFDVFGAQGGAFAVGAPAGSGGMGGHVQATVTLIPGATMNMRVGGAGQNADVFCLPGQSGTVTLPGGFNGGGTNTATCSGASSFDFGGSGGG